jgi:hypothetical protein
LNYKLASNTQKSLIKKQKKLDFAKVFGLDEYTQELVQSQLGVELTRFVYFVENEKILSSKMFYVDN